jgi:hypothetical protein
MALATAATNFPDQTDIIIQQPPQKQKRRSKSHGVSVSKNVKD